MPKDTAGHSMDDVLAYVNRFADGMPKHASTAMFYFLYKEILVNRIAILEADSAKNRGAIEHNEKIIDDLNVKLMEQLKREKP